jgi:hypothetical protein
MDATSAAATPRLPPLPDSIRSSYGEFAYLCCLQSIRCSNACLCSSHHPAASAFPVLASDFLAEIDGHRELLRIGVSVNICVGRAAFSVVNDEETLMKLLPTAYRQWQQPAVTMMPPLPPSQRIPPCSLAEEEPVLQTQHSALAASGASRAASVTRRRASIPGSSAVFLELRPLEEIEADCPSKLVTRRVAAPEGGPSMRSYAEDEVGIPCPGNNDASLVMPASTVRIGHGGAIARYFDNNGVPIGSVLRSHQRKLPGEHYRRILQKQISAHRLVHLVSSIHLILFQFHLVSLFSL